MAIYIPRGTRNCSSTKVQPIVLQILNWVLNTKFQNTNYWFPEEAQNHNLKHTRGSTRLSEPRTGERDLELPNSTLLWSLNQQRHSIHEKMEVQNHTAGQSWSGHGTGCCNRRRGGYRRRLRSSQRRRRPRTCRRCSRTGWTSPSPEIHWCPPHAACVLRWRSDLFWKFWGAVGQGRGRRSGGSLALLIGGGSGSGAAVGVEFFSGSFFLCCKKRTRLGRFLWDGLVVGLDGPDLGL